MPIYEYTCRECGTQFEEFVRSMLGRTEVRCPDCGGTDVKKGWSTFGTCCDGASGVGPTASTASSCAPAGT